MLEAISAAFHPARADLGAQDGPAAGCWGFLARCWGFSTLKGSVLEGKSHEIPENFRKIQVGEILFHLARLNGTQFVWGVKLHANLWEICGVSPYLCIVWVGNIMTPDFGIVPDSLYIKGGEDEHH